MVFAFFFFSSRRRHTRLTCDWSSDVCSSDLNRFGLSAALSGRAGPEAIQAIAGLRKLFVLPAGNPPPNPQELRSEERRVGKEWRSRGGGDHLKKKNRKRSRRRQYECVRGGVK